jgi:hypothetical protein
LRRREPICLLALHTLNATEARGQFFKTAWVGANDSVGAILRRRKFFCRLENSFKKLASVF